MREIKFRAWNKEDKIMFYNVENTYDYGCKGDNNVPEDNFGEVLKDERYEVMQFTGLYDKNKVPIYEGDILNIDDECWIVSFEYGKFIATFDNVCEDLYEISHYEVIGNIYENPEWVKGE